MKKIVFTPLTVILMITLTLNSHKDFAQVNDSVKMNAGYAKEAYYSFANGLVDTVLRNTWDISFRTSKVSSSILINDGAGVVLWSYHNSDTNGWATVDTAGINHWTPMYNDPTDWENGAFSRHATGHPDYGWGVYNTVTHDLIGDSLFIIKLRDGSIRKIFIERKNSVNDIYYIRFANLDGTGLQNVTLDLNPYLTANKDFVGYSIQANQFVDYQPAKTSWDIVFTKYMSIQPDGTPYVVTGVLNNPQVKSNRFYPVPLSFMGWSTAAMDSTRSPIGWDWKVFDMVNFVYVVQDSLVFFVRDLQHNIYKLRFTRFDGSSTGKIVFAKQAISGAGIADYNKVITNMSLYPNPAAHQANLSVTVKDNATANLGIFDLTGRLVSQRSVELRAKIQNVLPLNINQMSDGIYFLRLTSGSDIITRKLVIQK